MARRAAIGLDNPVTPPRYVSIAAELRDRITALKLAPHTLLPSERELSEQSGVSRMTARHAITLLENEGYVYRRPPRGTFVAEPRVPFRIGSFTDEAARLGLIPTAKVLWAEEAGASPVVRLALGLEDDMLIYALKRLRFVNDEPMAIEATYIPAGLAPGLLDKSLDGSLWDLLRDDYALTPTDTRANLQFVIIDDATSRLLDLRTASPGILLTRHTYDQHGRCIEYARDTYRADRASFDVTARIQPVV